MHILFVSSNAALRETFSDMLEAGRHNLSHAESVSDMIHFCEAYNCDLVLMDENLGNWSPVHAVRELRQLGDRTPVICLAKAANGELNSRLLTAGADDCVNSSISRIELEARISAIVRRSNGHADDVIRIGPAKIDLSSKLVSVNGCKVPLTRKEYLIVEALSLRKNMPLSKEQLMNQIYGGLDEPCDKIIDVFVCKIRKKFRQIDEDADMIETVWGRGYLIRDSAAPAAGKAQPDSFPKRRLELARASH